MYRCSDWEIKEKARSDATGVIAMHSCVIEGDMKRVPRSMHVWMIVMVMLSPCMCVCLYLCALGRSAGMNTSGIAAAGSMMLQRRPKKRAFGMELGLATGADAYSDSRTLKDARAQVTPRYLSATGDIAWRARHKREETIFCSVLQCCITVGVESVLEQ